MLQKIKTIIRKLILISLGKVSHLKISKKQRHIWYGNTYGGFYVCPDYLSQDSLVYSFGIGEDISFDDAIIDRHRCHVYGFDPTPKSLKWIQGQEINPCFHFYDYGISNKSGLTDFYLPRNPEFVSGSIKIQSNISVDTKIVVKMKSLNDIVQELGHSKIDILKMDIEGAEYDVIEDILNSKIPINQILVEFHDRFVENGREKTTQAISMLKENGFEIFAVSDSFEEISFINTKCIDISLFL
jgi:FkbM family methyltransferase